MHLPIIVINTIDFGSFNMHGFKLYRHIGLDIHVGMLYIIATYIGYKYIKSNYK